VPSPIYGLAGPSWIRCDAKQPLARENADRRPVSGIFLSPRLR
jgi:hypothetical protein